MAKRSIRADIGTAIGLCLTLALANPVQAAPERPARAAELSAAPAMPLGAVALPPLGFLDMCERAPGDCLEDGGASIDIAALRAAANRRFWSDAFSRRTNSPAALTRIGTAGGDGGFDWSTIFRASARSRATPANPSAQDPGFANFGQPAGGSAAETARTGSAAIDTAVAPHAGVDERSAAPRTVFSPDPNQAVVALAAADVATGLSDDQAVAFVEGQTPAAGDNQRSVAMVLSVEEARPAVEHAPTFLLDREGWSLVNKVNRKANRSIRQIADVRQYGVEDYWVRPVGTGSRGDCEDYVLAKRQALIEAGVPAGALSIAIVETGWGETHAVLLLASDQGEYVLDSLTPWVSRWDRVNYVWRERQVPGRTFDWVQAAL